MRFLCLSLLTFFCFLLSCKSAPPAAPGKMIEKSMAREKERRGEVVLDYTVDWRKIADLAGKVEYDPYVTDILWRRLNWRDYVEGKAATELVADLEREHKWDKRMKDWEAKRKPAAGESESGGESEGKSGEGK